MKVREDPPAGEDETNFAMHGEFSFFSTPDQSVVTLGRAE